ncbi:MAG: XRE family transcriptional regulator [Candidatus Promineifilaceae bacterium]|nr:XRE family transcriptional regulator [Candidatus Promineifilaceae bacterium]
MDLGQKIKARRKKMKLSLRELAEQVSLTASFLSQVERGLASPSIESLRAISKALDVPVFHFLIDMEGYNPVIRAGERRQLILPQANITYELLTPVNRKMEIIMATLEPTDGDIPLIHHQHTEECIYVLEGELEVALSDEVYVLQAGDTIYFEGAILRRLAGRGDKTVRYLAIITPPIF